MSSSDDDDELPPILNSQPGFSNTANKQSINDLFEKSCVLIHELSIEKQVLEDAKSFSSSANVDIKQENNLEANDEEMIQENIFLKRPNNVQYFSSKDITLKNCGYNYKTEMSSDEQIMFALEPHELFELILTGNVCRDFLNANSLVHFLIQSVAIHSDAAIICSSQRLIKSLVTDYEDICFTCEDIFQILFNCSADVTTSEIFKILKPYRVISPSCKSSEPIPQYWLVNLKAALCSLADILKVCRIPEEDLDHIVMCFLIMSVEREPAIYSELQKCLVTVLDRFFDESWPIYRLTIANRLASLPNTSFLDGQWLFVYEMVRAIPIASLNGEQLRQYICVRILLNLTDFDNKQSAEYSEELFSLSTLGIILHSLDTNDKKFQHVIIKFLDILVNHLKFTIEEYEQLCRQLKKAQKNFEMSSDLVDLELIHTRINLSNLNIKILKPLKYKNSQLKYADSDEDVSDHETTPNHVNVIETFEDALDDIPPEQEYSGMSPLSNVAQKNDGVSETMEVSFDDPKNQFEDSGAFLNETEKLVENSTETEYLKTASSSNFTQKDNKVLEKTENNSEKPNCLFAASKETTGELINETGNILELQTLSHGPQFEESKGPTSGQQSLLKIGDENGLMATTVSELPNTKEPISVVSSEDCLHSESQMDTTNRTFPKISDYCSAPNFIWDEHSYSNSPNETLTETIGIPLENSTSVQVLGEFECLSSKESKVVKEEVSEAGSLLVPEIHASTSEASTNGNLADSSLSSITLPNQDSSSKESSSKTKETPPTIIQSNLNNAKHLVHSNVPIYSTGICKQIPSPASLVEEILEIVPVEQSVENSLQLPLNEQQEKASDNSALQITLPVYSTDICKQIPSASLVEEILEIVPAEQSVENSLQLPLNEQQEKASDNSALQITLPVYSTDICKHIPSPASLVEEILEIVPAEQSVENSLQLPLNEQQEKASDNSALQITLPVYSTDICKHIPSAASLVEEILEIVPAEQSVENSLQLPLNEQQEKASDNSALQITLPVYSTDICKQIPSPASLVEEIQEIVPAEQPVENSLQLPLNEQQEKTSDNSALQKTLPVYSTDICKQIPSPASLVEEIVEIVPAEQSAENVLQVNCEETSDNSLYETLDEQFRNDTASPLSLLNSLNEIYCRSKKLCLSSALSNNKTSNPSNSECYTHLPPESQTSASKMPDIVLSSLGSFSTTPKRKLSTSEQNISPASASKKRLIFSRNTITPTIINVSAESITAKENDNATPLEVKDFDSTLGRYTALSTFDIRKKTPTKNSKITKYFQVSSSGTEKSCTNNSDEDVIVVDSSDSEDDCQVVEVKQSGLKIPQVIFLD
ncbi:hypothetical protein JTE90_000133 [Oedothorax gibbosus]|uniref:Uncharacterized protein n=1 Tax=Oedothorax gibbosus TaxID=931172 RepID=A0AAV6V0P9_9ARAC|nr:hypothetical protein JTE90_000133 [Oedothorax gibbosus]